jgi:hypothetical protein
MFFNGWNNISEKEQSELDEVLTVLKKEGMKDEEINEDFNERDLMRFIYGCKHKVPTIKAFV